MSIRYFSVKKKLMQLQILKNNLNRRNSYKKQKTRKGFHGIRRHMKAGFVTHPSCRFVE